MGKLAISDAVLERLKGMAARADLPLEKQAEILLEDGILRWEDRQKLLAELDDIAAMTPKGVPQTDSVALLREERDR